MSNVFTIVRRIVMNVYLVPLLKTEGVHYVLLTGIHTHSTAERNGSILSTNAECCSSS